MPLMLFMRLWLISSLLIPTGKRLRFTLCIALHLMSKEQIHQADADMPYIVIAISGSWPILSAASREFSTNSLTLVYKHLPGCSKQFSLSLLHQPHATQTSVQDPYVVKASYVLVFCKELGRGLLLQHIRLAFCHECFTA